MKYSLPIHAPTRCAVYNRFKERRFFIHRVLNARNSLPADVRTVSRMHSAATIVTTWTPEAHVIAGPSLCLGLLGRYY